MHSCLAEKRIVVTRAAFQAAAFCTLLEMRGAKPLEYPCIQIVPPADPTPLDEALQDISRGEYDGLILTSANAVNAMVERLAVLGLSKSIYQHVWIAAIGPMTAEAIRKILGQEVNLIPDEFVAEHLAESLHPRPGERILLPRAESARDVLAKSLEHTGAHLKIVTAYRTQLAEGGVQLPFLVEKRQVDAITLTSSSIDRYFVRRFVAEGGKLDALKDVCVACIGPVTAKTAADEGLKVQVMAQSYTTAGLIEALEVFFKNKRE